MLLEVARRVAVEGAPVGLELLFTVEEEDGLRGAQAFDAGRLSAEFGYVFDHASPIGEVIVASPTYFRIAAEFHGRAAHAGLRPEDGRSAILAAAHAVAAMPHGRIDEQTTANVGSLHGGVGSTNVVPERCRVLAEARSIDADRVEAVVAAMIDAVQDGAAAARVRRRRRVRAAVRRGTARSRRAGGGRGGGRVARLRLRAAPRRDRRRLGRQRLVAEGFPCVNLANGTERNHEPTERVSVVALEGMLDVALRLLDEAAAV